MRRLFQIMASSPQYQKGCTFCTIAQGNDEKTVPLYKDEELIVFKDRKPAAPHHYLVCPLTHIRDAKALTRRHVELVQRMVQVGRQVLEEKGGDFSTSRLGFHWPPFHMITHLHLHVIGPESEMGFIARGIFKSNSYWFVTVDWLIDRLKKMPEEDQSRVVPQ